MNIEDLRNLVEELLQRVEALEDGQKKSRKKRAKPATGAGPDSQSPVGRVRDVFLAEYERVHKHPYPAWGARENGQATQWLKSVPLKDALEYAALYPHWKQKTVLAKGHPFGLLPAFYVELVAHRKRYPQLVEEIARTRAREFVISDRIGKDEEVKIHGQLSKGKLDTALSFGGVGQISHEDGKLVPGPRHELAGRESNHRTGQGNSEGSA